MENESKEGNTISDGTSLLATQNTIGAQKRAKRPTAPPVLQRIRPMSKRKKFKKSLGPDFLEPAELGMQYLRDTYEPKCDICSLTMFSSSTSLYVSEELLHCNNCDAKAHPSCVNLNEEVAHKTQWQCHNCKVCTVCQRNESNEYLIICFTCSKGFHVKCHSSPIIDRPKGHWYCKHCCSKGSTNSSQMTNGVTDRKTEFSSEESSHSEDNETEVVPKVEKRFKLVIEDVSISKDDISNDLSSDDMKAELKIEPDNQEFDQNSKDCVSTNGKVLNGIDNNKDETTEEEESREDKINDNHNENQDSQNNETNSNGTTQAVTPQKWTVEEVETFIREAGFPSESLIFKEQEIDGRSLLLLRRMDVLTGLSLKLGPALKIYNHISRLQGRDSNDHSNSC